MCSLSSHHKLVMNDYAAIGGDLTDIFQAGAPPVSDVKFGALPSSSLTADWGDLASISCNSNVVVSGEDFGDPFSDTRDPLLGDGDSPPPFTLPFVEGEDGRRAERIKAPFSHGVFSRILQITAAPSEASPLGGDFSYSNGPSLLTSTMTEDHGMMRIRSPLNNPSMKRRKIHGKKVVCIPAPTAANSRTSSGEVVPSDLWAWRKYGQKPIKGSPFPRGYYRCSSSKGCSARKQVERSRTDPNMLVITYTSEHNHPWPSQRNALAGLTRSTSKGCSGSKNSANSSRTVKSDVVKGEKRNGNSGHDNMSCTAAVVGGSSVKEETDNVGEKPFDAEDAEFVCAGLAHCYRPSLMDRADHHPDDFFAELGEIEADPYELLFKQGFLGNDRNQGNMSTEYPFNLLDWADDNNDIPRSKQQGFMTNPNVQ